MKRPQVTPNNRNPNALPIYVQISELLIRDIAAGRLIDGERLPPERDMAVSLNVSVGTLRKSLAELEKKGMLERIHGSGNYIRETGTQNSVYAMFRLELPEGGGLPRADILSVDYLEKPADLPRFGLSDYGSRVRRMRYLNDTIIAVEEIWLDESAGIIDRSLLSDSLYRYYQQQLGFWITRAEDRVSIGTLPDWTPGGFTKPAGQTAGYIERFSWSEKAEPVEFSKTWFDPDRATYVQRLK
ncbi:transcriptional regulator, GntR family [Ruegeria halocynthiae]|uniref:Transcriptional regulator, GntR family n=1 Tax=Ruegeria halocynthiae TaxID=985054 RepID=A0A1H3CJL3_9RHOB|nr:GntR family transcriptional regulator [Ruegeria halocynthiae]SDX53669.1 transcriptional regulator, GntR family [Ruegeria halocynthiae]